MKLRSPRTRNKACPGFLRMILNICLGVVARRRAAGARDRGRRGGDRAATSAGRPLRGGRRAGDCTCSSLARSMTALPIVLLHGASGNLARHAARVSASGSARRHRVILIDRPGHGWSERPGGDEDASPSRQAALIAQALDALGVKRAIVDRAFVRGRDRDGVRARFPRARRRAGSARAGHASVAGRHRVVLHARVGARDRPAVRPHDRAARWRSRCSKRSRARCSRRSRCRRITCAAPRSRCCCGLSAFLANARDVARLKESVTRQSPRYARDHGADRHHHRRPRHHRVAGDPLARARRDAAACQADHAARCRSRGPARRGRSGGCRDRTAGARAPRSS